MKNVKLIWNNYDKEETLTIDTIEETLEGTVRMYLENKIVSEYNKQLVTFVIVQD